MFNCRGHADHLTESVKMTDLVNFCENRVNSFKNLLLHTHQSQCYQIWVTTLSQDWDVKLRRSCRSCYQKCFKMANFVNFWDNHVNSFKNLFLQTHQSERYQILVTTLGQGKDVKLRRSCRSCDRKCVKMAVT